MVEVKVKIKVNESIHMDRGSLWMFLIHKYIYIVNLWGGPGRSEAKR